MEKEIETHPIPNGFIPRDVHVLVIGTFPPRKEYVEKKEGFFFYSSEKNHFWNRMDNIFNHNPGLKRTKSKNSSETFLHNRYRKEAFAKIHKIGFLDIFHKISRKKDSADDNDIISIQDVISNGRLKDVIIKNKDIKRICCTYKLAYEVIKNNICHIGSEYKIEKDERTANGEKIILNLENRKIEVVLLYPATRSGHKSDLKDIQYQYFLFH